ncbi:MAG: methyltransferase domain-containing protein [Bacteroidetes bacterium]|nr:methyltransferase domain-containing protein [Bacteroidota bacterium]
MFAHPLRMFNYRKTLYENYYSTHSGVDGDKARFVHFEQQRRYFRREFEKHLPDDKSIQLLDVGCGTGSFLKATEDLGYTNARGIDLSPEQVQMASTFGVKNVELANALEFLGSHQNSFDVITAIDLIEHLSKDELVEFLGLVRGALKDGGKAIFRTPNMDSPQASVFAFADFTHEVFLNKNSSMQVMSSCGFTNVKVDEGYMFIENPLKEFFRKIIWWKYKTWMKIILFATARTWHDVVFTPNIVISGIKK